MKLFQRKTPAIRVGAMTSTGHVREENQDNMSRFFSPLGEVFVVADGMGGHKGGALAAEMVTHGMEKELSRIAGGIQIPVALQTATQNVNEAIHQEATSGNPETEGMGSTVVLAVLAEGLMFVGNVGDSRAYLFRKGRLSRLTRDHTRIQKMVDSGILTEAEGREHPDASILNRNMGGKPQVEMEVYPPVQIQDGDVFILCTDGLCGYVVDDAIGRIIAPLTEAQVTAEALVNISLQAGGEDNVTVQVIQCGQRKPGAFVPAPLVSPRRSPVVGGPRKPKWGWIVGLVVLLLGVLGGGIVLGVYAPWQKDLLPEKTKTEKPASVRPKATSREPKPAGRLENAKAESEARDGNTEGNDATELQELKVLGHVSAEDLSKLTGVVQATIKSSAVSHEKGDDAFQSDGPVVWFVKGRGNIALKLRESLGYPESRAKQMPDKVHQRYPRASYVIVPAPQGANTVGRGAQPPEPERKPKIRK